MDVDLVLASDKTVLANLLQLYLYDFSEIHGNELTPTGTYYYPYLDSYFADPAYEPWLVTADGKPAGFALARTDADTDGAWNVSEFFVVRKYRRRGVARTAARLLFARHPGPWTLSFHHDNPTAIAFWRPLIREYGPVAEAERRPPEVEHPLTRVRFHVPG